jgi:hypothetical protein
MLGFVAQSQGPMVPVKPPKVGSGDVHQGSSLAILVDKIRAPERVFAARDVIKREVGVLRQLVGKIASAASHTRRSQPEHQTPEPQPTGLCMIHPHRLTTKAKATTTIDCDEGQASIVDQLFSKRLNTLSSQLESAVELSSSLQTRLDAAITALELLEASSQSASHFAHQIHNSGDVPPPIPSPKC